MPVVDILMYHSISDRGGPTAIRPEVFEMQMDVLAASKVPVIDLDRVAEGFSGGAPLPPRSVVITFDDAFSDFAGAAWPVLSRHGFAPIVYVPTGFVGRAEGWRGIADPPRKLMSWAEIRALAGQGVSFGCHTVSHPDLTSLDPEVLAAELDLSRRELAGRLGSEVRHFAPPYGLANAAVRAEISRRFVTSVGTGLGSAGPGSDLHDLPRIEMFYFQDAARWRRHLEGKGALYLARRRALRGLRSSILKPWAAVGN